MPNLIKEMSLRKPSHQAHHLAKAQKLLYQETLRSKPMGWIMLYGKTVSH